MSRFVSTYTKWKDVERFARVVPMEEIAGNDYNLNIARYVGTAEEEVAIDVKTELATLKGLITKRDEAETIMLTHLKELGYDS